MTPETVARRWDEPALFGKALPVLLLQALFFLAPLVMTFILTFQRTKNYQLTWTWSLDVWTEIFTKPHFWTILGHTLVMAVACTHICILISLPVAYALATRLESVASWRLRSSNGASVGTGATASGSSRAVWRSREARSPSSVRDSTVGSSLAWMTSSAISTCRFRPRRRRGPTSWGRASAS